MSFNSKMNNDTDFKAPIGGAGAPTVAVIGCGPGGMSFLHALATKRKQLEESGDTEGLLSLPNVTCFERTSSPGGVWRSNRDDETESTNMYEGLWINSFKETIEFFDYSYDEHFGGPMPSFLPRKQILEYMMARVTIHEDIFLGVQFNTTVQSVTYDEELKKFIIQTQHGDAESQTQTFDKCIWASGVNGKPLMIKSIVDKLTSQNFTGEICHSSEMNRIGQSVKGKRILMIGDSYSAEDLALQCIKLGAEKIYIASRGGEGICMKMGAWPQRKVLSFRSHSVVGVRDGSTILCKSLDEDYKDREAKDISIVIFCTGYKPTFDFIDSSLLPWDGEYEDEVIWSMPDKNWKMSPNSLTDALGHIEPSAELIIPADYLLDKKCHNYRLMSNPNMMYICEEGEAPLVELDIAAWTCLKHICSNKEAPPLEQMKEENLEYLVEAMDNPLERCEMDKNYNDAMTELPDNHWIQTESGEEYEAYLRANSVYEAECYGELMTEADYPVNFVDSQGNLNKTGEQMVDLFCRDEAARYELNGRDKKETFRDVDVSANRSIYTGTQALPLKGMWLDLDDDGNVKLESMQKD